MTKVVLFDLDGTLLPMDFDVFVKAYFGGVARKLAARGYDPQKLVASIWQATAAMIKNDGKKTNEAVFWDEFAKFTGKQHGRTSRISTLFIKRISIRYNPFAGTRRARRKS